ncbi:hypothetical protein NQ318_008965 [Aromia moschata]|uniref:Uncharacterized protein n=1 Tax=Aromia moschata TaxID=1265417 RepID=A0AAV8ZDL7_9CUCU|nr:hypothetical protein NQ318_008965 [Aromia moschata]
MSKAANKTRKINLESVCRACLSERGHLRDIHSTKIPKMMESCASVQVCENDGLPGRILCIMLPLDYKIVYLQKETGKK